MSPTASAAFLLLLLTLLHGDRYIPVYAERVSRDLTVSVPVCTTGIYCCDLTDETLWTSFSSYDFTDRVGCVSLFSNTCNNTQLDASFCECGPNSNLAGTTGDGWYYHCDHNECVYDTTHTGIPTATGGTAIMESHYSCALNKVANGILGLGKSLLAIIIGAVVGGIIALILLCVCIAKFCCKPNVVVVQQTGKEVEPK